MSVSDLKNKLLKVVRRVERGEVFEITKDGEPVAVLSPRQGLNQAATGFGRVEVKGKATGKGTRKRKGSLDLPPAPWTYDVKNLKRRLKPKREP